VTTTDEERVLHVDW